MPAVSFVSLLSYGTGPPSAKCPNGPKTHIFVPGREIWMFPFLSAHDAPLQMSGLSIEACSMASRSEPRRRSGLLPLR
jgi:hypothetical protein